MSFSYSDGVLRERIDREYRYNDYWIWAFPNLQPQMHYSLVVQDGPNASACFNKGQNSFFVEDPEQAAGYADTYLTDYLVRQAQQYALVGLLKKLGENSQTLTASAILDSVTSASYLSLEYSSSDLVLLIDATTFLPYAVRANENHAIFGSSTSDVVFSNYTSVVVDRTHSIFSHIEFRLFTTR